MTGFDWHAWLEREAEAVRSAGSDSRAARLNLACYQLVAALEGEERTAAWVRMAFRRLRAAAAEGA